MGKTMLYASKPDNRLYSKYPSLTAQGIINTIRYKYDSMETAYLSELNEEIKYCEICSKPAKFTGVFHGYQRICDSKECKATFYKLYKRKYQRIKDYVTVQCKVCNKDMVIRNLSNAWIPNHCCDNDICVKNNKRSFMKETYIIKDFEPYNQSYLNILAYNLMCKYKDKKKVRSIFYKNFFCRYSRDGSISSTFIR